MNDNELSTNLEKLGFTDRCIVETILVTKNLNESYNAAPMGIIRSKDILEVRPFKSSLTYKNLHRSKLASINITEDPMLFFKTAFKRQMKNPIPVNDWIIQDSNAAIFVEKQKELIFSSNRALFTLIPTKIVINKNEPTVFSRGRAEAIEAIIHATRVYLFQSEKNEKKAHELLEKIKSNFNVISRVSDKKSDEMRVVECLKKLFKYWGIKN
jgi:hypothetical protein